VIYQLHAPAALPPEESPRCPLYMRLGGPQSRSGRRGEEKILEPYRDLRSDPSVVQPVASHYTDYAIPAPSYIAYFRELQISPKENILPQILVFCAVGEYRNFGGTCYVYRRVWGVYVQKVIFEPT
jgi:hypothetical protein